MTTDTQKEQQEFQKESIRLAEVRLQQIHDSLHTVEKKAVLLITFCGALITFLFLDMKPSAANASFGFWMGYIALSLRVAAYLNFSASMLYGVLALDFGRVGMAGLNPNVSEHFFVTYKNHEQVIMRNEHILKEYQERIQESLKNQERKVELLKLAKYLSYVGSVFTFLWLLMALLLTR